MLLHLFCLVCVNQLCKTQQQFGYLAYRIKIKINATYRVQLKAKKYKMTLQKNYARLTVYELHFLFLLQKLCCFFFFV